METDSPEDKRKKVIISYGHEDKDWLERVRKHLKGSERRGLIDVWVDTNIQPGAQWLSEINGALASAKVAVLLISANFFASDFIAENELPLLLGAAERNELWILALHLSPSEFEQVQRLSRFQSINSPSQPLNRLSEYEQELYLNKLRQSVLRISDQAEMESAEKGQTERQSEIASTKIAGSHPSDPISSAMTSATVDEISSSISPEKANTHPAQVQLKEIMEIANDFIVEENFDQTFHPPKDLSAFQVVRLHLLTSSWMSSHTHSSLLDNHEANLLYLFRDELKGTFPEHFFVLRTILNDGFGYVPGWYWFRKLSPESYEILVLRCALNDNIENVRQHAFELLSAAKIPIPDRDEWCNALDALLNDRSSEVRKAGIAYLGVVGANRQLRIVREASDDDDSAVSREAVNSEYLVLSRAKPSRALKKMLDDSQAEIEKILPELRKASINIETTDLVRALQHPNDKLKLFAAEELKRRSELTHEMAHSLKGAESGKLKEFGYRCLVELGEEVDSNEIYMEVPNETYNRQYNRDFILFTPSYSDPEAIILKIYRNYTTDTLWRLAEWESLTGHVAYKALAIYRFSDVAAHIRDNLSVEFKPEAEEFVEKQSVNEAMLKWEVEAKKNAYIVAALAGLAKHGQTNDVEFGRKYLSHEDYDIRVEAVRIIERLGGEKMLSLSLKLPKAMKEPFRNKLHGPR